MRTRKAATPLEMDEIAASHLARLKKSLLGVGLTDEHLAKITFRRGHGGAFDTWPLRGTIPAKLGEGLIGYSKLCATLNWLTLDPPHDENVDAAWRYVDAHLHSLNQKQYSHEQSVKGRKSQADRKIPEPVASLLHTIANDQSLSQYKELDRWDTFVKHLSKLDGVSDLKLGGKNKSTATYQFAGKACQITFNTFRQKSSKSRRAGPKTK
jgi:hypothetical protein